MAGGHWGQYISCLLLNNRWPHTLAASNNPSLSRVCESGSQVWLGWSFRCKVSCEFMLLPVAVVSSEGSGGRDALPGSLTVEGKVQFLGAV